MEALLSVCLITYNHVKYIGQAIEGVLMQHVDFPFELVIADDCSTDGTREILIDYQNKYPDRIKLILQTSNVGAYQNWKDLIFYPRSKYIAYFEGDDYWTDPDKLQKQVEFLEGNDDFAICFHRVYELAEGKVPELSNLNTLITQETYTIEDIAKGNFMYTVSVVFRNGLFADFPSWLKDSPVGDYPLHMLNAKKGLIKYFPEIMAVYRKHAAGIWSHHDVTVNNEKMVKVIDYLLTEDFDDKVKENLQMQKRKCINEYLLVLMESDPEFFVEKFKMFSERDQDLLAEWAFITYPTLLSSARKDLHIALKLLHDIQATKSHRFAKKLVQLKSKFFS
ncbi:MAG: glycosyltransferase [Sphingobacteriales bacterium]|nr:MAG: glycosyltransferase [Sphingobacteriales bacterium]